jgi:hypothetical protein
MKRRTVTACPRDTARDPSLREVPDRSNPC